MKKSKVTRSLLAACSIVALTAVMYGCVHSSDGDDTTTTQPTTHSVSLASAADHGLSGGEQLTIKAGTSQNVGNLTVSCPAGGDDCMVTATMGADGTISVTSTGGMATAAYSDAYLAKNAADAAKMTKAAYDTADAAHTAAKATEATEKGNLDAAKTALDAAVAAVGALGSDATAAQVAAAAAAYQQANSNYNTAKSAYDAAVADSAAKLAALDTALDAWAKADPDAVGLKNAMAQIAALKTAQDDAAKKAAEELKKVQQQLDTAKAQLAAIQKQMDDAKKAADDKAMADMTAGYAAALMRATDGTADRSASERRTLNIGANAQAQPAVLGTAVTVERQNSSLMLTASGYEQRAGAAPSIGTGWNGAILDRSRKDSKGEAITSITADTTAYVYSDITQAESASRKLTFYDGQGDNNLTAFQLVMPVASALPNQTTGIFALNNSGDNAWWKKDSKVTIPAGTLPTALNTTKALPNSFSASLTDLGISGTMVCTTAGGCSIKKTGDDEYAITATQGGSANIEFRPSAGKNASFTVYTPDDEYVTFGWWITTPDDDDGKGTGYVFGSFADAQTDSTYTSVPEGVAGTANYKGPAAGLYAEKEHGAQAARSGMFTAEAALEANFLDANNGGGLVSGTVTKFMSGGKSLGDWTVILGGSTKMNAAGTGTTTELGDLSTGDKGTGIGIGTDLELNGGVTSSTFDGIQGATGSWQGEISGKPATDNDAPDAIVGTFNAGLAGGVIQVNGGFGAEKK